MVGDGVCPGKVTANRYVFAVRTSSTGKLLWTVQIGDVGYNYGKWGIQLSDGNFVISGSKSIEQKHSKYGYIEYRALWVLSRENGTILSETTFPNNGESQNLRDGFMCINPIKSSQDEYVATGYIGGEAGDDDEPMFLIFGGNAFLMKFKYSSSTFKFEQEMEEIFNSSVVGKKYIFMQGMRIFDDPENKRYGISAATHNTDDESVQFGMISTDYSGKLLWSDMFPAANQFGSGTGSHPYSLTISSSGDGWVISGLALRANTGVPEGRMAKIGYDGNLQWDKRFVYPTNSESMSVECYGVSICSDGGYITTCGSGWEGQIDDDHDDDDNNGLEDKYTWVALLHRTDSNGEVDWQKSYTNQTGPNNAGEFVVTTKEGGYAMYIDSNTYGPPDTGGNFGLMVLNPDD